MTKQTTDFKPTRQRALTVDLGDELLAVVEVLRRQVQDALPRHRRVSLADVVRLALRRLQLACILHDGEAGEDPVTNLQRYMGIFEQLKDSGICPPWLIPGQPEETAQASDSEKPKPAGRARKRAGKPNG